MLKWFLIALTLSGHLAFAQSVGIFEGHSEVGATVQPGTVAFDAKLRAYTVTGSGDNMWAAADAFHMVWKKASGDLAISAEISFPHKGGNAHKKGVLMFRQSLDADSAYVDAALHGDGLTSLQSRLEKGAATHEVQANISAPTRLRLEKRGAYIYMWIAGPGEPFRIAGGTARIPFSGDFYVGLGVCAHDKNAVETATFTNVEVQPLSTSKAEPVLYSALETITVSSTDRRAVHVTKGKIEAPNWTPDGTALVFNGDGHLWKMPPSGGKPEQIDTGILNKINNDHGISADGTQLAVSDSSQEPKKSAIYVLPFAGGTPKRITTKTPSYWHGWSPDGKTLAYCAERNGNFDIYTIPVSGGEETRLTTAEGLDDGPEYSPDGKYIYFNSVRTGLMQIWRMKPDGSEQEQLTSDGFNNWFPHLSPDGKSMAFISFEKDVVGHPPNKDVQIRMMTLADQKIKVLASLFGGQGTLNVASWSPDSKKLAFVSYLLLQQ